MTKNDKILAVYIIVLIVVSACFDSNDGPRAGGHTNWLKCQSLEDCQVSSQAVDCKDGYCVDMAGERIISAVNDLSVDSSVRDNGDHDGGGDGMLAGLVERTFLLESSQGFEPVTGATVRLSFGEGGELGFSAGCNSHSGTVEVRDGYLWVASLRSTEIGCVSELSEQDKWLVQFFISGPAVTVDGDRLTLIGDESKLVFLDREVADPDRPLAGPLWFVDTFIEGGDTASSQTMQENPTLMFSDDGRVSVDTTCNTSTGRYSVVGEELTLSEVLYTEAVCSDVSTFRAEKVQAVMRDGTLSFEIEAARLTLMRGDLGLGALAP